MDEEDRFDARLSVDDGSDPRVHLLFNAISCLSDVVDGLRIDTAFSDEPVGLKFIDGSSLHLLLQREVVPVIGCLQRLKQVVLVEDGFLLVGFGPRVHLEKYTSRFAQSDDKCNGSFPQAFLENSKAAGSGFQPTTW